MQALLERFPLQTPLVGTGVATLGPGELKTCKFTDSYYQTRDLGRGVMPHEGIDIACEPGTPVVSSTEGTVTQNAWQDFGGWLIMITGRSDSGNVFVTLYAHLCCPAFMPIGSHVVAGTLLGLSGQTGGLANAKPWYRYSVGPHLHFSSKANGKSWNPYRQLNTLLPARKDGVRPLPIERDPDTAAFNSEVIAAHVLNWQKQGKL